jgi:hypothetical protein
VPSTGLTRQFCHGPDHCRFASRLWNMGIQRSGAFRLSDGEGLPHPGFEDVTYRCKVCRSEVRRTFKRQSGVWELVTLPSFLALHP